MPRPELRVLCPSVLPAWVVVWLCSMVGCGAGPMLAPDSLLPASVDELDEDSDVHEPASGPDGPGPSEDSLPLADAGFDLTVYAGEAVSLDGSASADPDGDPITFRWTTYEGDPDVALSRPDTSAPSFVAPAVDADIVLRFTLVVSDGHATASDTVSVSVLAPIAPAAAGPIAHAGPDQTVDGGAIVTLDGTASESDTPSPLGYDWVQVSGPTVALSGRDSAVAGFVAPVIVGGDAILEFELTVGEGDLTSIDKVVVVVRAQLLQPPAPPLPPPTTPTDNCPNDPNKTEPGACGCGVPDIDTDSDAAMDCVDLCANDPAKTAPGVCGCGVLDLDSDADGARDCVDSCPNDTLKTAPGVCGCGVPETDRDGDATPDCADGCPDDPTTTNPVFCQDPTAARDTDWELYMLRLVNRARRDPAGEAARIGSGTVDTHAPVPPLAYDLLVGDTANNHNDWMHDNFGSISSGRTPDSFAHYETLDGLSTGAPAVSTPSYTGARVGDRLNTAGYPWSNYGENIQTNYSTVDIPVSKARIDSAHLGWWNSSGHRSNMLTATFTSFGFHIETRTFTPPRGGLNSPFDNLLFTTQNFSRPLSGARMYILGLIYVDRDLDGAWTPRPVGDSLREGSLGVDFQVFTAGTATLVASGTTFGNGAFSARVVDGVYDLVFTDASLPGGQLVIEDIAVSGTNVDVGDFRIGP